MAEWITIMTFTLPGQAYVAQSLLESEEIPVFLKNEILTNNFYTNAAGGVKVQVPDDCVERALEILRDGGYITE